MENFLLSVAVGDISGQPYEFNPEKDYTKINLLREDNTFTDDSVCTFAIAETLLSTHSEGTVAINLKKRCLQESMRGYGGMFRTWLLEITNDPKPYNSFGNGSAMRCAAAAYFASSPFVCENLATLSARITHDHPEGIKGAVAASLAMYYALHGESKKYIEENVLFKYYPEFKGISYQDIWPIYGFDETCQGTVPVAIITFLESKDFEDCMKLAISLGGDADTLAAIAAPMAYGYYGHMPKELVDNAKNKLKPWMLDINDKADSFHASIDNFYTNDLSLCYRIGYFDRLRNKVMLYSTECRKIVDDKYRSEIVTPKFETIEEAQKECDVLNSERGYDDRKLFVIKERVEFRYENV